MITCEDTRNFRLTGRVRLCEVEERLGLFASARRVALVVEEQFERARYSTPPRSFDDLTYLLASRWRAATPLDLSSPAMRWLVDGPADQKAGALP